MPESACPCRPPAEAPGPARLKPVDTGEGNAHGRHGPALSPDKAQRSARGCALGSPSIDAPAWGFPHFHGSYYYYEVRS